MPSDPAKDAKILAFWRKGDMTQEALAERFTMSQGGIANAIQRAKRREAKVAT